MRWYLNSLRDNTDIIPNINLAEHHRYLLSYCIKMEKTVDGHWTQREL